MHTFRNSTATTFAVGAAIFCTAVGIGLGANLNSTVLNVQQIGTQTQISPPSELRVAQGLAAVSGPTNGSIPTGWQNQWAVLFDNNPATMITLTNFAPSTNVTGLLIDFGHTNWVDRVVICGTNNSLMVWPNYSKQSSTLPLGLIVVYIGTTPQTMTNVGSSTIPYDAGNPINEPFDIRFSPTPGRYVRIELQTRVNWPAWSGQINNQYGWTNASSPINQRWELSELEFYGSTGSVASNAVVLESNAPAPLQLAANDLSYYLGELTGQPHPIITPAQTNSYSGTLYMIVDLKPLASDYATMTNNLANGTLPTNEVNVTTSGREVMFTGWPYRCVCWSVWEFLEKQGVRWVYPDIHGDYVPQTGVSLALLPLIKQASAKNIYANWDAASFEPWPTWVKQSTRQEYLYVWRNRWNSSWSAAPIGGGEVPLRPSTGAPLDASYAEGFWNYPHSMNTALPPRILATNAAWWGSPDGINLTNAGVQFDLASAGAASWLAAKVIAFDASFPVGTAGNEPPLSLKYFNNSYNLMPMDSVKFSLDPESVSANALYEGTNQYGSPPLWVYNFGTHSSGAYYKLLTTVANLATNQTIGGLAYQDVFDPPISNYPSNVRMEVTLWGQPNLPMTSPKNTLMKSALDAWRNRVANLNVYDYSLLFVDYWQPDPHLPVPMVSALVGTAQYLAGIGAINGGCQALLAAGNTPATDGIKYNPWDFYAYPRIRWNTNQTGDQLLREFFTGYYQEASAPMLAYYQAMENYQYSNNVDMHYKGFCYWMDSRTFPLFILSQMQTNLYAAQLFATNWYVVNRIRDMTNQFDWLLATRGITNITQLADYSSFVIMPANGTYWVNLADMVAASYVPTPNQVEHRNNDLNLNGPCEAAQTFLFTKAGKYRIDIVCAGNYYYNLGQPAYMNVMLGPSSTGFVPIANGFQTNSYTLNIPTATAFDFGLAFPTTWSNSGYVTVRQIGITAQ